MNIKELMFGKLLKITLLAVLAPLALSAGPNFDPLTDQLIKERITSLNSVISIRYTDNVRDKVYFYVEKHKVDSEKLIGKIQIYQPLFEFLLKEKNLPQEFKFLPVIESGLRPGAISRVGAAGLWQFMQPTANVMGLRMNTYVDERRDPVKATEAALEYLQYLYNRYGDWTLVLAAYNCGEGNVNKAIRKAGGKRDYWKIQQFLPKETRDYIPKFIAVSYMFKYYELHDIIPVTIDADLLNTATAKVYTHVDLRTLAKDLGMDYNVLRSLNPSYLKGYIPKSSGRHLITLPINKMYDFIESHGSFDDLLAIGNSSSYAMPIEAVAELKKGSTADIYELELLPVIIESGSDPGKGSTPFEMPFAALAFTEGMNTKLVKLNKGQSLVDLAVEHGVDLSNLITWNNYSEENLPKLGDLVKIKF